MKKTFKLLALLPLMTACSLRQDPIDIINRLPPEIRERIEVREFNPNAKQPPQIPLEQGIECENEIVLPPHKVNLYIDPKDVFWKDGLPYVTVDGQPYQILELIDDKKNYEAKK